TESTIPNKPPPLKKTVLWAGAIALAFILGGVSVWWQRPVSSELPLRKLELQIPGLDLSLYSVYSISPNAKSIAYVSNHRLWIRELAIGRDHCLHDGRQRTDAGGGAGRSPYSFAQCGSGRS